jgi:hypothetical protein
MDGAAQSALAKMLSGTPDYVGQQASIDAANAPILRNLNQSIIPGLNQRATFLNNSTGGIKALNRVLPDVTERMSLNANDLMNQERIRALNAQNQGLTQFGNLTGQQNSQAMQAASLFPQLSQLGLIPSTLQEKLAGMPFDQAKALSTATLPYGSQGGTTSSNMDMNNSQNSGSQAVGNILALSQMFPGASKAVLDKLAGLFGLGTFGNLAGGAAGNTAVTDILGGQVAGDIAGQMPVGEMPISYGSDALTPFEAGDLSALSGPLATAGGSGGATAGTASAAGLGGAAAPPYSATSYGLDAAVAPAAGTAATALEPFAAGDLSALSGGAGAAGAAGLGAETLAPFTPTAGYVAGGSTGLGTTAATGSQLTGGGASADAAGSGLGGLAGYLPIAAIAAEALGGYGGAFGSHTNELNPSEGQQVIQLPGGQAALVQGNVAVGGGNDRSQGSGQLFVVGPDGSVQGLGEEASYFAHLLAIGKNSGGKALNDYQRRGMTDSLRQAFDQHGGEGALGDFNTWLSNVMAVSKNVTGNVWGG